MHQLSLHLDEGPELRGDLHRAGVDHPAQRQSTHPYPIIILTIEHSNITVSSIPQSESIIIFLLQNQMDQFDLASGPKEGNMPQFIKNVPWYLDSKSTQPFNHQKTSAVEPSKANINQWYSRGSKGYQATSFRKGACQNCGAMGHNKKQCTERPRKTGAKFQGKNIAADDVTIDLKLDWQGKRDRWVGFDPAIHKDLVAGEFEVYEEIQKKRGVDDKEEFRDKVNPLDVAQLPSKHNSIRVKTDGLTGIRNREDTANYVLNLNSNSAAYDPKSRVMLENPTPHLPENKQNFKGHSSYLNSGDQLTLLEQEKFVQLQAELQNSQLNSVALPSLTEYVYKTVKSRTQAANSGKMGELLNKYGGSEYINNKPQQILSNETYQEFTKDGKMKKQNEFFTIRSRYQENVYVNDHTSVWGSWWNELLGWGYNCCHNNTKMSMCTGEKGHQLALQREMKIKKQKLKREMEEKIKLQQAREEGDKGEEQEGKNQQVPNDQ